jgi:flagellin-like hook-associated protein FlgL
MLDMGKTRFEQIFKKEDYKVNVNFAGANDANETYTDGANQAMRAMFEASSDVTGTDIDTTNANTLSADQRFTITGEKGARAFDFGQGTHLGEVVTSINNVSDSMGVSAQLMFNNTVTGTTQDQDSVALGTFGTTRTGGEIVTYHMDSTMQQDGNHASETVDVTLAGGTPLDNVDVGRNTDGHGRVYLQWKTDNAGGNGTYDIYKDADMTQKIGQGVNGVAGQTFIKEASWHTNAADTVTFNESNNAAVAGDVTMVQLGNAHELNGAELDGSLLASTGITDVAGQESTLSGIDLGYNTDSNGRLYLKVETGTAAGNDGTVSLYKDSAMRDEDLVAQARNVTMSNHADDGSQGDFLVSLSAVNMNGGDGPSSGLYATLSFNEGAIDTLGPNVSSSGELSTEQLGVRLYSNDYGANQYVSVDAQEGAFWGYYSDATDNSTAALLDASSDAQKATVYGQDATVTVNGREMQLDGIRGKVSNQDLSGEFEFNAGKLGETTVAQTGYSNGSLYSRARDVNDIGDVSNEGNYATNAIQNTSEVLDNFTGGMQFQLGEGQGDQERTVYGIRSMAVANLGQVSFYDDFEGAGLKEWKNLTLQDALGGGLGSLATDPVKSLTIIDKAIDDVSSLRAQLGAFQANMLQTNANSLNVAIENITATESDIRDADMAQVSTQFTKNQILVQAGTSMLAQANATQQNVLQLLG